MTKKTFDYSKEYNEFWSYPERWGASSFEDVQLLKNEILQACGYGKILDVGCGMGALVLELCRNGIDAFGIDVADVAIHNLNLKLPNRFQVGSILNLPYEDNYFDTVVTTDCLEHLKPEDIPLALEELYRITKKNIYVRLSTREDYDSRWHLTIKDHSWWERKFFEAGFRKHPAYYSINKYNELEDKQDQLIAVYEKIEISITKKYNLKYIESIRELHTDMTRETGCRSDGHIIRYFLATEFIQTGDSVLDCACGLGYGSYLISNLVGVKQVQGIDITDEAIDYAKANFGNNNVLFKKGDAQNLDELLDNSVDFITSFETLEHIPEPESFLKEAYRVLKPGGRIMVSVPNRWLDENGVDPSQYHLHTYSWEKLCSQMQQYFYPEKAWTLTMNGYFNDGLRHSAPRSLKEFSINGMPHENSECILMLAMKDPLSDGYKDYEETAWGEYDENHNFVAFKRDYINPYIWKIVLSSPHRDIRTNIGFCQRIIDTYPKYSADYGGALCYLSYRILELLEWDFKRIKEHIAKIDEYLESTSENRHVYRWKISLTFVKAQLFFKIGDLVSAKKTLIECLEFNPNIFSPTIATKIIKAYEQLAFLESNDHVVEQRYRKEALEFIQIIFKDIEWTNVIGNSNNPVPFGLKEIAEICNIGAGCAWDMLFPNKPYIAFQKKNNHNEIIELKKKINELETIIKEKEKARITLENQIVDIVSDKEKVWQLVYDLQNSLSWKVTKPLRFLKKVLKK